MLKELRVDDAAPWKQRYRLPITYAVQIAALMPTRGLAVSNKSGIYQLYAWHVPTGELTQLTNREEGVVRGSLSPDGANVYYLQDHKGDEFGHIVRVPFDGGSPEDITPDLPLYTSWSFSFSRTGNRLGFTAATNEGFDIYCIDVGANQSLSAPRKLYHCTGETFGPFFSYNGESAVIATTEGTNTLNYHLVAFDATSGQEVAQLSDGEESSIEAALFSPVEGDMRLLATTDRTGFKRPLLWNPLTDERSDLPLNGLLGEVFPQDWSPDGSHILLCQFVEAVQHLYLYDAGNRTLKPLQHPGGTFGRMFFGPEGDIFVHWENATQPPQLIALDDKTGIQKRVVMPAVREVPPGHSWKSVTFTSSDGRAIQGWLGLPEGEGPFPTILETHGGPTAVVTEVFAPNSQAWLDHGFAFLTINYRGSTSFGRDFEEKIRGNIGRWELEDMVAGRRWLVEQGIAEPGRVFLTGWSYGGYLTLFALGKQPELWAGGMAGVAFGDYAIAYEDEAETLRAYDRGLMGGTPQEKPEAYAVSSPITYAAQVKAPVLIIQGRNDTRCPPRSIEVYETKMKELGKPVEVYWFDAGHGSLQVEQRIDHQERMMRFAYQVLGT
jgi:dipeptidyl aminopeptidase/acylaminoacyl peptidase